MPDRSLVDEAIQRIVAGAGIPTRSTRDDLRRELYAHFEDACGSPDAAGQDEALRRFGAEAAVIGSLKQVYRLDRYVLHLLQIVASILISVTAALAIQVAVNLRVEIAAEALRLAPGFSRAAGVSIAVVLGLVTAWEASRRPFSRTRCLTAIATYAIACLAVRPLFAPGAEALVIAVVLVTLGYVCSKLETRPRRFLLLAGAFAAALYVNHYRLHVAFGPAQALRAGVVLTAVWTSTVVILSRIDRLFLRAFDASS